MTDEKVYTIEECAKILNVAPRIVCKWFDSGRLKGYNTTLHGFGSRRVKASELIKFMKSHGLPLPDQLQPPSAVDVINETISFYRGLRNDDCNVAVIAALQSVLQKLGDDPISKETINESGIS